MASNPILWATTATLGGTYTTVWGSHYGISVDPEPGHAGRGAIMFTTRRAAEMYRLTRPWLRPKGADIVPVRRVSGSVFVTAWDAMPVRTVARTESDPAGGKSVRIVGPRGAFSVHYRPTHDADHPWAVWSAEDSRKSAHKTLREAVHHARTMVTSV